MEKSGEVIDAAAGVGVLHEAGEDRSIGGELIRLPIADDHLDAKWFRAGGDHIDGLRVAAIGDKDRFAGGLLREGEGDRFGSGRAFIEQRGICDIEAGEAGDHRLEIEQGLETALRDFRLVRGVGGVPAGVFQNVAQDHAGGEGAMVALTDEGLEHAVFRHDHLERIECRLLAQWLGEIERFFRKDALRDSGLDKTIER